MSKWVFAAIFISCVAAEATLEGFADRDSVLLKDGSLHRGLIVQNTAKEVLLQGSYSLQSFPKSEIVRIHNEADIGLEFTKANTPGDLPAWRVMVNDLRNNDSVKSLEQIPATAIDNGIYKNIPYLSFRINGLIEMNIYGDPDDPGAVEFGAYGRGGSDDKIRRVLRSFLAGFLSSRKEVGVIYSLPLAGGKKCVGDIGFLIIPPTAPDAYGGWWISLFNPQKLKAARLSDAEYAKLTRPFDRIVDKTGRVKRGTWSLQDLVQMFQIKSHNGQAPVLVRGFYRDEKGRFKPLADDSAPAN